MRQQNKETVTENYVKKRMNKFINCRYFFQNLIIRMKIKVHLEIKMI